jgi:hypothetical protein
MNKEMEVGVQRILERREWGHVEFDVSLLDMFQNGRR